jgi:hypothetical protein
VGTERVPRLVKKSRAGVGTERVPRLVKKSRAGVGTERVPRGFFAIVVTGEETERDEMGRNTMGLEDAEGATETAPFCQGFRSLRLRCWICRAWGGGCEAVKAGLRRTRLPISLWPLGFFYYWRRRAADGMDGRYSFAGARGGILLPVPSTLSRLASPAIQWDLIFLNTFFLLFHLLFFIVVIDFLFIFDLLSNLK